MKIWLFCLGMILIALPLAAQSPAAPTNVVLNLTPTDSLGLFLPGYDVIPQIEFEVADTLTIATIHVSVGTVTGDTSILLISIPFQSRASYFFEGLSIVRAGNTIWVECGRWPYYSEYFISIWLTDSQGVQSPHVLASKLTGQ